MQALANTTVAVWFALVGIYDAKVMKLGLNGPCSTATAISIALIVLHSVLAYSAAPIRPPARVKLGWAAWILSVIVIASTFLSHFTYPLRWPIGAAVWSIGLALQTVAIVFGVGDDSNRNSV